MHIYTITTFQGLHRDYGIDGALRCVGYYANFEDADDTVRHNYGDIFECLYRYAVIEKVEPGLYPLCSSRWFYKFNFKKGMYEPIEEPAGVKHIVNFAIG